MFEAFDLPGVGQRPGWLVTLTQSGAAYKTIYKPRGANGCFIFIAGGGGGGGGGFTGASLSARGGGGGGGGASVTRVNLPACFLPDIMYGLIGPGGAGGAASTIGVAGAQSFLSLAPNSTGQNVLLSASGGGAGGAGLSTAGGPAGTGGAALTNTTMAALQIASAIQSLAGASGTIGGAQTGAVGGATTLGTGGNLMITGGTGGGGTNTTDVDFAGGAITGAGLWPGNAGGLAAAGAGNPGFILRLPNTTLPVGTIGGTGGGTAGAAGVGGVGGRCPALGGGGGGGGGGVTGGAGGRGGDGLILLQWY